MNLDLVRDKLSELPALDDPQSYISAKIWHCGYKSLEKVGQLKNLKSLVIATLPDDNLDFLTSLSRLEYLQIIHLPNIKSLIPLSQLTSLRELSLETLPSWDSSKNMRRLKNKIILHSKRLHSKLRGEIHKKSFIHEYVPYFSQWESRELVEKIITKQIEAKDDPRWRESGAKNTKEYTSWSWSGCGMACLKMILAHKQQKVVPLVVLGKQCLEYGGYKMPLETSPGLFYKPFVDFIGQEYGLCGKAVSALTLAETKQTISDGGYAIASVTAEIRFPFKEPSRRGGHVVLVFGYDDEKQVIHLHNPSGFRDSQEDVTLSYKQFMKFFDHKGILIKS